MFIRVKRAYNEGKGFRTKKDLVSYYISADQIQYFGFTKIDGYANIYIVDRDTNIISKTYDPYILVLDDDIETFSKIVEVPVERLSSELLRCEMED